jgi:hypothetical protein
LAPDATEGSGLQRTLNSLFFERVTLRYGERWARHLLLGLLPIGLLATATTPVLLGSGLLRLDRQLHPQADGSVTGQPDPEKIPVVLDSSRLKGNGELVMAGITMADIGLALAALVTGATMIKRREEH